MLALRRGGFVLRNPLDLKQGDLRVFGRALFGGCFPYLRHDLGKGAGQLEPFGAVLQLFAKSLPVGFTQLECLAVLASVGTTLVACIGGFELTIGAQKLPLDQAKAVQKVDHHRRNLVDDVIANAVAEVT